jgi:phage terminase large subunit-like protein
MLGQYPEVRAVLVEVNQGGDLWREVLHHLPGVKVLTHWSGESKEVRFARTLEHYQRGRVVHERRLDQLEEQQVAFPRGAHDDIVDAVAAGVAFFLDPDKRERSRIEVRTWAA